MPGIARRMKLMCIDGAQLLAPRWQFILYWLAYSLKLSVADIETRHPRSDKSCNPNDSTSFSSVVSNSICTKHTALVRAQVHTLLQRSAALGAFMYPAPAVARPPGPAESEPTQRLEGMLPL